MTKMNLVREKRTWGDTAVDGLLAGLVGGLVMGLFLGMTGWLGGGSPLAVWSYFAPAGAGSWVTGLLAHLAISAIYGVGLGILLGGVGRIRPSLTKWAWLWGAVYGLLLWGLVTGVMVTAVDSPLNQIPNWEFAMAHLLYGLVTGYRLQTSY